MENAYQIFCYLGEIIDISRNHNTYQYIIAAAASEQGSRFQFMYVGENLDFAF